MADAAEIPDRGPTLRLVNILFMSMILFAVSLRCYVRIGMVKAFGPDDWLIVIATIFYSLYCGFSTAGVSYGTGRHRSDLPPGGYERGMQCWWFCYLWYASTMMFSKLSIGCFLTRLIAKRLQKWIIWITMFVSAVAGIIFFFITLFQCSPISYFWEKNQPGWCIRAEILIDLSYLYSTLSCLSDFIFALLPAYVVWSLKMRLRTKIALIPLLAMGCVASCAVAARFPYLPEIQSQDFLWDTLDVAVWSTVEQGLAITAASLATIRPLLRSIGYRMGWTSKPTKPSAPSSSDYYNGTGGRSNNPRSHLGSHSGLEDHYHHESYKLSAAAKSSNRNPISPWDDDEQLQQFDSQEPHAISTYNDRGSGGPYIVQKPLPVARDIEALEFVEDAGKDHVYNDGGGSGGGAKKKGSIPKTRPDNYIISSSEEELRRPSSSQDV